MPVSCTDLVEFACPQSPDSCVSPSRFGVWCDVVPKDGREPHFEPRHAQLTLEAGTAVAGTEAHCNSN